MDKLAPAAAAAASDMAESWEDESVQRDAASWLERKEGDIEQQAEREAKEKKEHEEKVNGWMQKFGASGFPSWALNDETEQEEDKERQAQLDSEPITQKMATVKLLKKLPKAFVAPGMAKWLRDAEKEVEKVRATEHM